MQDGPTPTSARGNPCLWCAWVEAPPETARARGALGQGQGVWESHTPLAVPQPSTENPGQPREDILASPPNLEGAGLGCQEGSQGMKRDGHSAGVCSFLPKCVSKSPRRGKAVSSTQHKTPQWTENHLPIKLQGGGEAQGERWANVWAVRPFISGKTWRY